MNMCICVRQTEKWDTIDEDSFWESYDVKFSNLRDFGNSPTPHHQLNTFRQNIEEWNALYHPNYFKYRNSVKEIARKSWESTGIDVISIDQFVHDANTIYIPTDDDDWFDPDIAVTLKSAFADTKTMVASWKGTTYLDGNMIDYDGISSNGYAFRGIQSLDLLKYHCAAQRHPRVTLNCRLSVWVRHLAAWCRLCQRFDQRLPACENIGNMHWASGYVRELTDICLRGVTL